MSRTRLLCLLVVMTIITALLPSFFQLSSTSGDSSATDHAVYCIGDSLTHYYWPGQLGTLLGPSYTVVNKGIDGNTTQMMLDRFATDVLNQTPHPDYVVVMGGINDVGRGYDVSLIEDNLQSMYTQAHDAGIKVIALTVTPYSGQDYQANKKTVNLWIMNAAANVDCRVDVYPLLEYPSGSGAMRPDYTVDGEHLNSAGGAVVAQAVYDALQVTYAGGSNVTNDLVGDLVVFSQDYTDTSTVPSNICLALDSTWSDVKNETLSYNGASHCVQLDATYGAVGKLFVGGLSPSLSTTLTLDMGMGRTEEGATVYVYAGGAWLAIRLSGGTPTDDLEITSYYYNYTNPTLHYATSVTPDVGFSGGGRFKITIVSSSASKINTIYLNDVEKLTTPYTSCRGSNLLTVYDPFVNPFIYFDFASISSGQTAYLQLYSIEQTVPEYSYITPISNPKVISFGVDGPDVWSADDDGLSLLDHGTIWADVTSINGYSASDLAALKALIADGFELGIHFSTRLSDLPLADATTLMNNETAQITAIFGQPPTSWCSLQGADNVTHAEYAYTNLGMVTRNGVNGSAAGLSSIGNLGDNCWNFWSSVSAAGIVIPSFSHQLDVTPAIAYSISPGNFSTFLTNYASNGVHIVGFREYWEKAQNSYHTDISNVVSDPGVSLSFTVANMGGKSRLLVNAPWANVVRDTSGGSVPYEVSGSGIVIEVGGGNYTVTAPPQADFSADKTAVVVGQAVTFTNTSSGGVTPLTYQWDFNNDGIGESTAQNPSYVYTSAGTYTVILKVTDAAANTDTETKANYITVTTSTATPSVTTNSASNVGTTSATLNGNLDHLGTAASVTVSFVWGWASGALNQETVPTEVMGNAGAFHFDLVGLTPVTTYYFRAKAVGDGTTYGDDITFSTPASATAPSVATSTATNLAGTSATLNGYLASLGTATSVNASFEWGLTTAYGTTTAETVISTGAFSANVSGLNPGITYHFRAKAVGNRTAYGDDMTFTTSPDTTAPAISAVNSSNIAAIGATINWTTNEMATSQVEYGLTTEYGRTTFLDTNLTTTHSVRLTSLNANSTYHYRVVSRDASNNQAVSADGTFTTTTHSGARSTLAWPFIGFAALAELGVAVYFGRTDMVQEELVRRLEEAVTQADLFERERDEATATLQSMEHALTELRNEISLFRSKAGVTLMDGPAPDVSKRGKVTLDVSATSEPAGVKRA